MQTPDAHLLQRAGVLALLPALLRELGVPPLAAFADSGIEPATIAPATSVPLAAILRVLHRASRLTGRDDIGLLLGDRFTLEIHGILGRLMRCAPTLRHALLDFVRWQPDYSTASVVYFIPFGDDMALGYGSDSRGQPGVRELQDGVMVVGLRMIQALTGRLATGVEVLLSHRPPADTAPYDAMLRAPVRFDQPQSCLILEPRILATPLPGANAARHAEIEAEVEAMAQVRSFASRVRLEARSALYRGELAMPQVAARLRINVRTLRRRLADEGWVYAALRDELRMRQACELLRLTGLAVGDIAQALAFASHGAFIEAFRRWMGTTPSAWRAGTGGGGAGGGGG